MEVKSKTEAMKETIEEAIRDIILESHDTATKIKADYMGVIPIHDLDKIIEKLSTLIKKEKEAEAVELKEYFDAGYDFRTSLLPEIIESFGENSAMNFEEFQLYKSQQND